MQSQKQKERSKKKKPKGIVTTAKKKNAIARASIKKGKGIIKINKRLISTIEPEYIKRLINEPVDLVGNLAKEADINITVTGGGFTGQAVAVRGAIAKAYVQFSRKKETKETLLAYDRLLLVDDHRRKEAKKPLGKGARAKKQQSKR